MVRQGAGGQSLSAGGWVGLGVTLHAGGRSLACQNSAHVGLAVSEELLFPCHLLLPLSLKGFGRSVGSCGAYSNFFGVYGIQGADKDPGKLALIESFSRPLF